MTLPKLKHPTYEVYLKSVDRKVLFRPFLVKEEKLLLMSRTSEDVDEITRTVKQIIRNCCLDDTIDVDKLPLFDVEMFFLHLRAKSIGEVVRLNYTCKVQDENGVECGGVTPYEFNIEKILFDVPLDHTNKIDLGDNIGIVLNYPSFEIFKDSEDTVVKSEIVELIMKHVNMIYDESNVYKKEEIPNQELIEFFDLLSLDQFNMIRAFFVSSPRVVLRDKINCVKCGYEHDVYADNLNDFFV